MTVSQEPSPLDQRPMEVMMSNPSTALADTLPGAFTVTTPRKPVGSRRDREVAQLRARVTELEEFVDTVARVLADLRRHVQFHGAALHAGCGVCCPTTAERAVALEFDRETA